jgi:SpoVK/Ycf46/Vps4 family AAA+-type ATPase
LRHPVRIGAREGKAHRLFHTRKANILLFDDIDLGVQQTGEEGHDGIQSTFLCGLDGLECRRGVVYLFTSNVRIDELDPAFRRPGRIDLILHFSRPDAALRRRFISEHWHEELLGHVDIERAVSDTDGLSFAEIDEVKRLLVLGFLDSARWDWKQAFAAFQEGRGDIRGRRIGFHTAASAGPPSAHVDTLTVDAGMMP